VSHYLSRLEAATGVKLIQRVGRGIRLTPEGQLLATRSAEIVGRVEAATSELAAQVGLRAGRVRLAANASSLSTIVPKAATALTRAHPGLELILLDRHPVEALQLLRQGKIDVALVYRYAGAPVEEEEEGPPRPRRRRLDPPREPSARGQHRQPPPLRLDRRLRTVPERTDHAVPARGVHSAHRIASLSDDMVVVQALVAAGVGVTTLPGLALRAHRNPGVHTTELTGFTRRLHAVTYGDPPDPPATSALIQAIQDAAQ
jgi:DNA-binding transcriptional LysR family regulator